MVTITQTGFDFRYRNKKTGQLPIVETWGIERVAAFMFLIEFYRIRSQRYVGKYTFVAKVGSIQYELENFDKETYKDVDKLTKLLVPYTDDEICVMWYTSFDKALDMAERMLVDKVKLFEQPEVTLTGATFIPKFYTRPTQEEYLAKKQEEFAQIDPKAHKGSKLKVWFQAFGTIPCIVVKETESWYWVDGYVDGKVVVSDARVKKGCSRIITDY